MPENGRRDLIQRLRVNKFAFPGEFENIPNKKFHVNYFFGIEIVESERTGREM
jgi:hypothetical protein